MLALVLHARTSAAQYQVQSWTTDNGLPHNIVAALEQTRDGYIWMATFNGLVRFDGVRFTVFDRSNTPGLRNNRFISLFEAADGALWAGTEGGGVTRYHQGAFVTYTIANGLSSDHILGITGDAAGQVWVLANGQIMQWDGARFHPAALDGVTAPFDRFLWNRRVFWTIENGRIILFDSGRVTVRQIPTSVDEKTIHRLEEDGNGTLWMGIVERRVARITGDQVRVDAIADSQQDVGSLPSVHQDRSGHQWALTVNDFLTRYWSVPQSSDPPIAVQSLLEDREGNIWLGTDGRGLYRIRQPRVTVYSRAQGLHGKNIYPVLADRRGSMWLGVWPSGVSRVTNGEIVNYTMDEGLASGFVTSFAEDAQGRVWVGANHHLNGGLRMFENGRFHEIGRTLVPPGTAVHAMLHARSGALWLGTPVGLIRYQDGRVTTFTTKDGLAADDVKTIIEESDGRLWVGSFGGVTTWKDGVFKSWTERDGLPGGVVRSIYRDSDGVLWVGTYDGGLGRYKDGRFSRITTREGLFDDGVFQILEDRRGYLWMSGNRGIQRVSKRELDAVADGNAERVTALSLGKGDGLLNPECNGGTWPSGSMGANGTLWFPTQDGVAVIDPETIAATTHSVPPRIETVLIDRAAVPRDTPVRVQPGQQALEIQYTGMTLVNSERIQFRYRLVGLDNEWVDAGTRRTAYYSHIPPGAYTFTVMAAGSDGVWTNDVASMPITVVPPFWRTWWFLTAMSLVIVALLGAGYYYRVTQLTRAQQAQQEFSRQLIASQERERQRIAAELHDSLGQSLSIIKNRALLSLSTPDDPDRAQEQLREIVSASTDTIAEVREIAHNLRPYQLDRLGVSRAIESMVSTVATTHGLPVVADVDRIDGLLGPEGEINLFRIVQESVNNVLAHAQATEAAVRVKRVGPKIEVSVEDNGRGFDPHQPTTPDQKRRGMGLIGMSQRARLLGATYRVRSAPGRGTTVSFAIEVGTPAIQS